MQQVLHVCILRSVSGPDGYDHPKKYWVLLVALEELFLFGDDGKVGVVLLVVTDE